MSPIKDINLADYTEAIPAFLTIIIMPLAYSISEGIAFGMIAFVILKILVGKGKEVSILAYIITVLFILKYVIL